MLFHRLLFAWLGFWHSEALRDPLEQKEGITECVENANQRTAYANPSLVFRTQIIWNDRREEIP